MFFHFNFCYSTFRKRLTKRENGKTAGQGRGCLP